MAEDWAIMNISSRKNNKIAFFVYSMNIGGTERQVLELAKGLKKNGFDVLIYSVYQIGAFIGELNKFRIPYRAIGLKKNDVPVSKISKLFKIKKIVTLYRLAHFTISRKFIAMVRNDNPDIIYSFGALPCALAITTKLFIPVKVIWGIRSSIILGYNSSWIDRGYYWLNIFLSRRTDLIISNSHAGKNLYVKSHYSKDKIIVIPNGIDIKKYKPDRALGKRLRKQLGIATGALVIGIVARLDPIKDHPTLLGAIDIFRHKYPKTIFLIVGDGELEYKNSLRQLASSLQIQRHIKWLDADSNIVGVYNALDIFTLTSTSEGWANVIGEAMACGKPCVTTDVGDNGITVKSTGIVVHKSNPRALALGWEKMVDRLNNDSELNLRCREIIVNNYSIDRLVDRFVEVVKNHNLFN